MKRRAFVFAIVIALSVAGGSNRSEAQTGKPSPRLVKMSPAECRHGVYHQADGPYAVIAFCDNALGSQIGVVYYDNLTDPTDGEWSLGDRFWQDPLWATDVTSFAWSPGGSRLYVATSTIYGSAALYELHLKQRTWRQVAPREGVPRQGRESYFIEELDLVQGVLRYNPGGVTIRVAPPH